MNASAVKLLGVSIAVIALALGWTGLRGQSAREAADLILTNGKIVTVDRRFSIAQAVAVKNGVFQAVGSGAEIGKWRGPATTVIDLGGKTVVPGFIDGHAHLNREGLKQIYPSLGGARSIADIVRIVEAEVGRRKPGEWVITMPVGDPPFYRNVPEILAEKRFPTRADLDAVSPDNPVYIFDIWPLWNRAPVTAIANSAALRLAGIDRSTVPPDPSITIVKDAATGEPNGQLVARSDILAFTLMKVVPRFTPAQRVQALLDSNTRYNASGTTSIFEGHGVSADVIRSYKQVWDEGAGTVRSNLVMSPTPGLTTEQFEITLRDWTAFSDGKAFGDAMLKIGGLYLDVSGGGEAGGGNVARLRAQEAPYSAWGSYNPDFNPDPGVSGARRFRERAFLAARYNQRVVVIVGNLKSMDDTLGVFEDINRQSPLAGRRWVLSHVTEASAVHLEQMKRLGIVPMAIPSHRIWKGGEQRLQNLPKGQSPETLAPYRAIMDAGLPLVLGTDNVLPELLFVQWVAMMRTDRDSGRVIGGRQALTREQALRAVTVNGAYATFEESVKGSIEVGKYADLAVLSDDYLTVPTDRVLDIRILMTILGGRVVYERPADDRSPDRRALTNPPTS